MTIYTIANRKTCENKKGLNSFLHTYKFGINSKESCEDPKDGNNPNSIGFEFPISKIQNKDVSFKF
jgi:hypothetical protein